MFSSAGRTSSQRRVLRPQSGFTQIWSGASRDFAFPRSFAMSSVLGHRGEWTSYTPGPISFGYTKSAKLFSSSMSEREVSMEMTSASSAAIDGMMSLNSQ